ncbi:Ferredoxin-A [Tetrabaena socialis]|uniref:Ferredoxin-A n=1 Tax=Tetrabaena socialis TaxID=47790 RepID=A0A2J8AIM9_9CHLO|nr:Ferredoxin-A [Tetrabaena socialis]|eukprot:PNH12374.1 Ferredoxin-A [Tetrabaena socialis]
MRSLNLPLRGGAPVCSRSRCALMRISCQAQKSTTEAPARSQADKSRVGLGDIGDLLGPIGLTIGASTKEPKRPEVDANRSSGVELGPISLSFSIDASSSGADGSEQAGPSIPSIHSMTTDEWRSRFEKDGTNDLWLEDEFNAGSRLMRTSAFPRQGGRAVHNGGVYGFRTGEGVSAGDVPVHKIKIMDHYGNQEIDIEVPEDRYILWEAEDKGLELPYACRMGCCTACAVRVTQGSVYQPEALGISQELREQGYALMCVGFPTSDAVMETVSEDEIYELQFGKYFAAQALDPDLPSVARDDFALEIANMDEYKAGRQLDPERQLGPGLSYGVAEGGNERKENRGQRRFLHERDEGLTAAGMRGRRDALGWRCASWAILLVVLSLVGSGRAACYELTEGASSPFERQLLRNFSQVLKCSSVSGLFVVPFIWSPVSVTVDCGKLQSFQVYMGSSPDELMHRVQQREQAWCGLSSLYSPNCQLQMSPFTTSYVGVRKILSTGTACRFSEDTRLSSWMLGSCLAGTLVFALAGPLSESMALRVTSGGLLFALGSILILIFLMARQVPGRRSMATTAMVLGSSSWALLRWLTGYWLPSLYALLHNRWLLAYLATSGLLGAALTYLYGGVENTKLNTLMRIGLQLLGVLLFYSGTWTLPSVFAAAVGLAVVLRLVRSLAPLLTRLRKQTGRYPAGQAATPVLLGPTAHAPARIWGPPGTPFGVAQADGRQPREGGAAADAVTSLPFTPTPAKHAPAAFASPGFGALAAGYAEVHAMAAVSPLVRAGLIINPLSGRSIKIGGDLYNRLVEQGYTPDVVVGRLQTPPPTPGSAGSPEGAVQQRDATASLRSRTNWDLGRLAGPPLGRNPSSPLGRNPSSPPEAELRALSCYLINAIMNSQSWQQLAQLARLYAPSFNHVHVSALVCRLPKLVTPAQLESAERFQFNRFLGDVSDLVLLRLPSFDPRAVANVLWAVSKLGFSPAPTLLNKFLFEAYVRMYDFNAQELANLSWSLATLASMGNQPVSVWMHKFTHAAIPRVPSLKPQELAHLAWALSKLCPPLPCELPLSGSAAAPGASAGAGAAASTPAAAPAAAAGAQPVPSRSAPSYRSRAGTAAGASALAMAGNGASPAASSSSPPADALPELLHTLALRAASIVPAFRCGELVMALTALHRLHPAAGLALLRPAVPHLLKRPQDLSAQDLANVWSVLGKCAATGLGKDFAAPSQAAGGSAGAHAAASSSASSYRGATGYVGSGDGSSDGSSSSSSSDSSRERATGWKGSGGSEDAPGRGSAAGGRADAQTGPADAGSGERGRWGSAGRGRGGFTAGMPPTLGRHHLYALLDATEHGAFHDFTAKGLCTVLVAWAQLGLQPSASGADALLLRYQQLLPAQATFQCVSVTLWGLARLKIQPPPAMMSLLTSCAELQMAVAKPCELVALAWALQQLRYRPGKLLLQRLGPRLVAVSEQLRPHGLYVIINFYLLFGEPLPEAVRITSLAVRRLGMGATAAAVGGGGNAAAVATQAAAAAAGGDAGATAAAGGDAATASADDVAVASPSVAVRFLASLAGVAVPTLPTIQHQLAAAVTRQRVRWRLQEQAGRRAALSRAVESATLGRLGQLSNAALVALLLSVSHLHLDPSEALMREALATAEARTAGLTPWQAGGLLSALARLRARPDAAWLGRVLDSLVPEYDSMTGRQLLYVLPALLRMHYRPSGAWMRGYFHECMSRVDTWPAADVHLFLRGLHAMGVRLEGGSRECQKLRMVVYRKKRPAAVEKAEEAKHAARGRTRLGLKRSLCMVCEGVSGCEV